MHRYVHKKKKTCFLGYSEPTQRQKWGDIPAKGSIWSCWSTGLRPWGTNWAKVSKIMPNVIAFSFLKQSEAEACFFGIEELQTRFCPLPWPSALERLSQEGACGQAKEAVGTRCPWLSTQRWLADCLPLKDSQGPYCRKGQLLNQINPNWIRTESWGIYKIWKVICISGCFTIYEWRA